VLEAARKEKLSMRSIPLALAAGALLLTLGACAKEKEPFGRLTVAEVAARRSQPNVFVYDNNPKEVFEAGHVPGATWVESSEVTAAVLPPDKGATLVFYCANEH
jgi:hypothetical protein